MARHRDDVELFGAQRQWLPNSALDEPIGAIGAAALRETAAIVTALIS
jgi:hypothetical protein